MKEINHIIQAYDKLDLTQQRAALATVVYVDGSSYRRTGARMLVMENGTWIGGISGGCLEGDALRKAKHAMVQNKPSLVRYDTREDDAHQIGVGLGCNGVIDVLIAPLKINSLDNPIEVLRSCISERKTNILLTLARTNDTHLEAGMMLKYTTSISLKDKLGNERLASKLEEAVIIARQKQKSSTQIFSENGLEWTFFIEVLPPAIHLVVYGGNYDIYPLVDIAKSVGWKVSVVANPNKVARSLFSVAEVISNKTGVVTFDAFSAVVLMAHDYKTDKRNFAHTIQKGVPYIGMLGPIKRSNKIFKEIQAEENIELGTADFKRIHAPIGLDTGAISPEEIAISIIAEIRTYFSERSGGFLKLRGGTIHTRE